MLVKAMRPKFAVEIGTFTGFSAISIARDYLRMVHCYAAIFRRNGLRLPEPTGNERDLMTR